MLSRITCELAQTMIDDSAEADQCFTEEEYKMLEHISYNIELWIAEEQAIFAAAEDLDKDQDGASKGEQSPNPLSQLHSPANNIPLNV